MSDYNFAHAPSILNEAIQIYLGSTLASPGYKPSTHHLDWLRHFYPNECPSLEKDIQYLLEKTMSIEVNWDLYPWPGKAENFVEKELRSLFFWLREDSAHALASYFTYQWK